MIIMMILDIIIKHEYTAEHTDKLNAADNMMVH